MRRWLGLAAVTVTLLGTGRAQVPELDLPRPGTIILTEVTGEVTMINSDQRRAMKLDERVRIGSTVTTGRKSTVSLALSNGALVQLGPESELEIEEFGQAPVSGSPKFADLKAEPTLSRTRLRLTRGDIIATVKPLKVSRGSTFMLSMVAGTLRLGEGAFRAMVRMHDLGLGVCTVELQKGAAEFEMAGTSGFASMPLGNMLAFAIELDKAGVAKVGVMPKEPPKAKSGK